MIPETTPDAARAVSEAYGQMLADVDARTLLPPAKAWEVTVDHLEESNRLKLVTLLGTGD